MLPHLVQGRALRTAASLDEGLSLVVPLHPYSGMEYQNNDHLVHLSAKLRTAQVGKTTCASHLLIHISLSLCQ